MNSLYRAHAELLNPFGYRYDPELGDPRSVVDLWERQEADDGERRPARIGFDPKYRGWHPDIDMVAFFAAHDRIHVLRGFPFTHEGEAAVVREQGRFIVGHCKRAWAVHAECVLRQQTLWREANGEPLDESMWIGRGG